MLVLVYVCSFVRLDLFDFGGALIVSDDLQNNYHKRLVSRFSKLQSGVVSLRRTSLHVLSRNLSASVRDWADWSGWFTLKTLLPTRVQLNVYQNSFH